MAIIQNACLYFKNSTQRIHNLQTAVEKYCPDARHNRLKQYCATRWVERHDSVFVCLELLEPLVSVFNSGGELS